MTPRPTSGPGAWTAQNTEETPMLAAQTLQDYSPLLDVWERLTVTTPGLPASIVAPCSVRDDDGRLHQYLAVHVDSYDQLLLWKSALGGRLEPVAADSSSRHHRVQAHVLDVRVEVVWIEDVPAAVAA